MSMGADDGAVSMEDVLVSIIVGEEYIEERAGVADEIGEELRGKVT
jgi:hypothetical protein